MTANDHPGPSLSVLSDLNLDLLNVFNLSKYTTGGQVLEGPILQTISVQEICIGQAQCLIDAEESHVVTVTLTGSEWLFSCTCEEPKRQICKHEALALWTIASKAALRIFFDERQRRSLLIEKAA